MREYTTLFNAVSDVIAALDFLRRLLIAAQQDCEEIYISREE